MKEWKEVTFRDVLISKVRNGIYKKKAFHGRGCCIVNMGELFSHPVLRGENIKMKRVELTESEKERFLLEAGNLIFARRSLTAEGAGKCTLIQSLAEETTFESSIIRAEVDQSKALSYYLYSYFNSPIGKYKLRTILRQVAVSGITGTDLMELKFDLPPLPIQHCIAKTLSLLDQKINLLHQQNQTLEAIGAAVFREWFAEGERDTINLGRLIENSKNGVKSSEIEPSDFYVAMQHLEKRDLGIYETGRGIDADSNKSRFSEGDILFGKLRPYFHKIGVPNFSGVCSTDILVLKPGTPQLLAFVLFSIHTKSFIDYCTQSSGGTRMPRVSYKAISQYQVPLAKDKEITNFSTAITPLLDKLHLNVKSIKKLQSLRDLLLPKLMSGQVKVRNDG